MVGKNILKHPLTEGVTFDAPSRSELNLRNKPAVLDYLKTKRPDLIIHAAGKVGGIKANIAMPYEFLLENLEIGINLISAAKETGIKRLLNLGSSCIYPKDIDKPLTEDLILSGRLEPTNEGYAIAKIAALRLCQFITKEGNGFSYKTIIPCNLYGPHDKFDLESAHLIPAIINKIHTAKQTGARNVEIWGDGSARREFMYAEDLAEAIFLAIQNFDALPDTMNIGLGHDHTVLEYYKTVADVIGWEGNFNFNLSRPTGMRRKVVDISRQKIWGFQPKTSLKAGIQKHTNTSAGTIRNEFQIPTSHLHLG